jgi:hypothetical protein
MGETMKRQRGSPKRIIKKNRGETEVKRKKDDNRKM